MCDLDDSEDLPRPPLQNQLFNSYISEISNGDVTSNSHLSRNNNSGDFSFTKESMPAEPVRVPRPFETTIPVMDPNLTLSPEKGQQTENSLLRNRLPENNKRTSSKKFQTDSSFLLQQANKSSGTKDKITDSSKDMASSSKTVGCLKVDIENKHPHVRFSDKVEMYSITPRYSRSYTDDNILKQQNRDQRILPSYKASKRPEKSYNAFEKALSGNDTKFHHVSTSMGCVTGLPAKTIVIDRDSLAHESTNVLSRPEFNSLLTVGKQIKDLRNENIDSVAVAEEKLKKSSKTRNEFVEKITRKINQDNQFGPGSTSALTTIDCDPTAIIESVEQQRKDFAKSSLSKVVQKPAKSVYPEPDVMKFSHMIVEKDSPSLTLHHSTDMKPCLVTSDPQQCFTLYKHSRSWGGLPS